MTDTSAASRPQFDFDRFIAIPRLSGLRLSPDGRRLVVVVSRPDPDGRKFLSSLWEVDPEGARSARRLTRSAPGESNAAFLPDGSIAFTSARPDPERREEDKPDEEPAGLWLLPADGGEARLLVAPAGGVDAVRAARDARVVAFTAAVHPATGTFEQDREREKTRRKAGVKAQLFEGYPIRHWDHYLGPRDRHLFAAEVPSGEERLADARDLTPDAGNALVEAAFDIAPDGAALLTSWTRHQDIRDLPTEIVAIDRTTEERRTLTRGDAWYEGVVVSPDGKLAVCTRTTLGEPDEASRATVWLIDLETGQGRDATPDLDLWPHGFAWAPDGSALYFVADDRGHVPVFRLALAHGAVTKVAADGAFEELCPSPDGATLFALSNAIGAPPRVVAIDLVSPGHPLRRIPSLPEVDDVDVPSTVERVQATAADGTAIESWLVKPADAAPDHPAPLVVWVHGGPLGSWNSWHWRWNPHLLVAHGYAILLPDPAISLGYGQDFIQRGWGRWGEEPFTDLMTAVEGALARPDIDRERAALMGGSFGGYMANWVAGHTDRFRAIVTHASLWELRGFHGTTDWGAGWEHEFGDPYLDQSRYEAASPDRHVGSIRTPVLVIHGELDHRVPISEGLRLWTDLSRHGVEAKFLYFPDENHWILKPQNARLWYETVTAFLDHHVRGEEWRRPELV